MMIKVKEFNLSMKEINFYTLFFKKQRMFKIFIFKILNRIKQSL